MPTRKLARTLTVASTCIASSLAIVAYFAVTRESRARDACAAQQIQVYLAANGWIIDN